MSTFRVALSADFRKPDGSPSFPEFDLSALEQRPNLDFFFLEPEEEISAAQGIPLSTLEKHPVIDLTIDGADEVDANLDLIKGGGGALVREKIIAHASKRLIIVVDEGKLAECLGTNFYLPVEVLQFGCQATQRALNGICGKSTLRRADGTPFVSDNGNYILDCHFDGIPHPGETELQLNNIPGSVENGLFVNRADKVVIGTTSGVQTKER